jgi:hypothetical protein
VFYAVRWTKLDLTYICFKKIKLTHRTFKFSPSIYSRWIDRVNFLHFSTQQGFTSAQLALSPPFPLLGTASPPSDIATLLCRVTFPSHWAKMRSLPPLHLLAMLRPIGSLLEPKLKHWICTPTASHPLQTTWLPLHCYKKVISTLPTLPTTQSTSRHRSLSPPSHAHHPSAQRHPQW